MLYLSALNSIGYYVMTGAIAKNKKANFNYNLSERFEAGVALEGSEVKSIRDKGVNISDSFVRIENNEAFVYGMHVSPYSQTGSYIPDPIRIRKLLLHKSQIKKLFAITGQKSVTIVPTRLYFKGSRVKLEIAVASGKKIYDKRESMKNRDIDKQIRRSLKNS